MKLHMTDMAGQKVLTMDRPWNWNCCCCELGNMCGMSKMEVFAGGSTDEADKIGAIRMPLCGGGLTPKFHLEDRNGDAQAVVNRAAKG